MSRCIKRDTKLRVASYVDKEEEAATRGLLRRVQARLQPGDRALVISNGGKGIPGVMLEVLGQPKPEPRHRGPRWKYPRLEPPPEIAYARVIKQRDASGRVVALQEEILWGEPSEVWARLDPQGVGRHISVFCVERTHLTSRLHNSRLARKTLRYSKERRLLEGSVALEDAYYNFCLPHESLKERLEEPGATKGTGSAKKWRQRTPMMAEGLTDHVWTLEEVLTLRIPPQTVLPT